MCARIIPLTDHVQILLTTTGDYKDLSAQSNACLFPFGAKPWINFDPPPPPLPVCPFGLATQETKKRVAVLKPNLCFLRVYFHTPVLHSHGNVLTCILNF